MYSMQVQKILQSPRLDMRILSEDILFHIFTFLDITTKEANYFMRYGVTSSALAENIAQHFEKTVEGLYLQKNFGCQVPYKNFEKALRRYFGKVPLSRWFSERKNDRICNAHLLLCKAFRKKIASRLETQYCSEKIDFISPLMQLCADIGAALEQGIQFLPSDSTYMVMVLRDQPALYAYPKYQTLSEAARTLYLLIRIKERASDELCASNEEHFLPPVLYNLIERRKALAWCLGISSWLLTSCCFVKLFV